MQLALVAELFYPHLGGQEIRYFDFCHELANQGHEVSVFSVLWNRSLPLTEKIGQIMVHRYAFCPHYVKEGSRDVIGVLNYSMQSGLRLSALRSFDAIIFNQWPLFPALLAEPLCHSTTVMDWCEPWPSGVVNALQKVVSHLPDGHTTVSDHIRLWLMDNYGIRPNRIESIPSAVKTSLYKSDISEKTSGKVVFIGRLAKHKRPDVLVEAVKIAKKKCPKMTLDIIGPGPMYEDLKERARSAENYIKIHGFLTDVAKIELLKKAWILALLSEREGFPRVVAEALAAGTPIITSDSPKNGTKHIVRETRAGIVCTPTASVVANVLVELYNNHDYWRKLSANALQSSARFDLSNVTRKLVMFIKSISGAD